MKWLYFRVKADNKEEKGGKMELDFVFWNLWIVWISV